MESENRTKLKKKNLRSRGRVYNFYRDNAGGELCSIRRFSEMGKMKEIK